MATINPATKALQNLLGCDFIFGGCRVGQDIKEVFRDLK